ITVPPPKIDGLIDDLCWKAVEPVSGFYQYDPVNGAKASEETLVWAAFDQDHLYFAFLMKDSQPDRIWAELTPRNEWDQNDAIEVILDAYNDKRTSITFAVNPRGVQKNSVETIWRSEAVVRPDGWSAEMAIPFKSLRFSANKLEVWGVNFERYIHRLNETDYWTDVDRDLPRLQQSGELCGLAGLRPGYNLEFFPYAGYRTSKETGADRDSKFAVGLDAKWGIKPNLYLDVTASPDFSEVESDPFIPQLSPYENYLQENRPFFTEGSRYFSLGGDDGFHGPELSLFYSRRIPNPWFATKLSGKTGGFGFGVLGAVNKVEVDPGDPDDPPRNSYHGVFRVQKDIFKNSQIGFYYAGMRDAKAPGGVVGNQNVALDFNFNFSDFYYIGGMAARTFNEGSGNSRNGIYQLGFRREPDAGLQIMSGFQRVEDDVAIRTGFIGRVDYQSFDLMAGHAWRYNDGLFKRLSFDVGGSVSQDSHGNATGDSVEVMVFTDFFNLIEVHGGFDFGRSKYQ
ncbi:MAG: carbohydrate binding family 9 domain-containing protein, partial [Candidatus Aminicenantes bacterium]|nr:carbohydrate binding family 9 domain-containing protein [Candidatus Aminicenantes bacterium]